MKDQEKPKSATSLVLDAGVIAGAGFFIYGLFLIWHPLAPTVGGLLVAAGCAAAGYDRMRRGGN